MNILRKYSKYLIDEYDRIMYGDGGRCMSDLIQFYETGRIKDLIEVKSPIMSKINILSIYREQILYFAKSRGINLNLITFEEFEIK